MCRFVNSSQLTLYVSKLHNYWNNYVFNGINRRQCRSLTCIPETVKRKVESNASKSAAQMNHWSNGLLTSMRDPNLRIKEDDRIVVIKDKYPKARFHYLVLPKEDILTIWHVRPQHQDLLLHMHNTGRILAQEHPDHEFIIGYHAQPSMARLHLHVISTDFDSPCLKSRYHWNSFVTSFFLRSADVCQQLRESGEIKKLSIQEINTLLTMELKCHKCSAQPKNMPQLKRHLLNHCKN